MLNRVWFNMQWNDITNLLSGTYPIQQQLIALNIHARGRTSSVCDRTGTSYTLIRVPLARGAACHASIRDFHDAESNNHLLAVKEYEFDSRVPGIILRKARGNVIFEIVPIMTKVSVNLCGFFLLICSRLLSGC